jgi:enamine deaminase RidA (YjgF/YER057c/UK114 family)
MSVVERLRQLEIDLPLVAAPVGAYVPAVRTGRHIYTSGQLPFVDGVLPAEGKVGVGEGLVAPDAAAALARTAVLNAVAAVAGLLAAETGDDPAAALDRVVRVVKLTGFVASDPGFTGQAGVLNGASGVLREIFGDAGVHARAAVGMAVLPLDSPVEVELVVETD